MDETQSGLVRLPPRGRYGMGWVPDRPEHREVDGSRTTRALLGGRLPRAGAAVDVTLERFVPRVRDQGGTQSCVGHAVARAAQVYTSARLPAGAPPAPEPSPACAYVLALALARFRDTPDDPGGGALADAGCSPQDAVDALAADGLATEAGWPFDAAAVAHEPDLDALADTVAYQGFRAWRVAPEEAAARAAEVEHALLEGCPVCVGFAVTGAFEDYAGGDALVTAPAAGDAVVGGHMVLVVGSFAAARLLCLNSWGPDWGNGGYFWADAAWLASASDVLVVTAAAK